MAKKNVETKIGIKYESKRHAGVVATVFDEDVDRKTVSLRTDDGKELAVTMSTLQRWWKQVVDTQDTTPVPQSDPTPVIPDPQPAPQPAPKADTPKQGKVQDNKIRDYVFEQVTKLGGTIFVPDTTKKTYNFRTFKVDGKMFAYFTFGKKKCVLRCRGEATQIQPHKTVNHMFNNAYELTELTNDTKALIQNILKDAYKYQVNKNANKLKKGETK